VATAATKREFCRRLYRVGGATPTQRVSFLDELSDAALEAQTDGKTLTATASGGSSASFMVFQAYAPADVLELVDEARAWAAAASLDAALALIVGPIRHYGRDFSSLHCGGGV
jgi:hypothetical protein